MYVGLFEMYKIGIGPSSSHTFGPMVAAGMFLKSLKQDNIFNNVTAVKVELFGSLSLTGKGHLTDVAIMLGLCGNEPESVDLDKIHQIVGEIVRSGKIKLDNTQEVSFELIFTKETLKYHENGMRFSASYTGGIYSKIYYSIGGGFVKTEDDFINPKTQTSQSVKFDFNSAKELVEFCTVHTMSDILLENEKCLHTVDEIYAHSRKIRNAMRQAIARGLNSDETSLPPPTSLTRRAKALFMKLQNNEAKASPLMIGMDWLNAYALAVSEENGAGGRVVTAPTNGACGVIPAVLAYHDRFVSPIDDDGALKFFLVSAAIGSLFKRNASIAGAEVGCQGEVGVASAMAAAGLAALYDASPTRICMAAEIAMEHHLGLTCDPVNGQVQIPCVERNAVAAVTAIDATAMALSRNESTARVSLDEVIETMRQTGKDMDSKYRETSCGGLALVVS